MAIHNGTTTKLKKACTDVFCGYDCLTKYAELKEVDRDLTERGFSQWMADQHKVLLEKMLQQSLSKEQMKVVGENIRNKMKYEKQVGEFHPPQPSIESNKESQENKKISVIQCELCGKSYDASKWDKTINGGSCPYCFKGLLPDGRPRQRAYGAGRKPKGGDEEDSDAVYQLKRWWKKATKKDRKKFVQWIGEGNN